MGEEVRKSRFKLLEEGEVCKGRPGNGPYGFLTLYGGTDWARCRRSCLAGFAGERHDEEEEDERLIVLVVHMAGIRCSGNAVSLRSRQGRGKGEEGYRGEDQGQRTADDETESCQDPRSRRRVINVSYGMGGRRTRTWRLDVFALVG